MPQRRNHVAAPAVMKNPVVLDSPRPSGSSPSASSNAQPYDDDARLVERFLGGDRYAFEQIYGRYYERVFALARGILLNPDDAADAVQEVFSLVYRNIRRFNHRSRFGTWLFRVAVNRIIQHGRRIKTHQRTTELTEGVAVVFAEPNEGPGDPQIEIAMSKLGDNDRALIVLFYWEELSLHEIAQSLGCGVNAAKTRLYRARERFRAAYEVVEP